MSTTVQLNLRVSEETRRLLEMAAAFESRPLSAVLENAIRLYVRSHSDAYRTYFDAAQRFLQAPDGSEEKALARAELAAGIVTNGRTPAEVRGGDVAAVRARLREKQSAASR